MIFSRRSRLRDGRASSPATREVGYIAKNNPDAFKQALEDGLLDAMPLYQINENAKTEPGWHSRPRIRASPSRSDGDTESRYS